MTSSADEISSLYIDVYAYRQDTSPPVGEGFRRRTMKPPSLPGLLDECLAVNMDDGERDETTQDFRVRVSSKRDVSERLDRCKDILRTAMDGQPEVDEDSKRFIVQELLAVSDERETTTKTTDTTTDSVSEKIQLFFIFI